MLFYGVSTIFRALKSGLRRRLVLPCYRRDCAAPNDSASLADPECQQEARRRHPRLFCARRNDGRGTVVTRREFPPDIKMNKLFLLAGMWQFAVAAVAAEVAGHYACHSELTPEGVTRAYIDRSVISKKPYAVIDSESYFAALPGYTAFGLTLVAIASFEEGSSFFHRSPGTSPGNRFALVVQGTQHQVEEALHAQKLRMRRTENKPHLMVEGFSNANPDPLPEGANSHYVYSQVICLPN